MLLWPGRPLSHSPAGYTHRVDRVSVAPCYWLRPSPFMCLIGPLRRILSHYLVVTVLPLPTKVTVAIYFSFCSFSPSPDVSVTQPSRVYILRPTIHLQPPTPPRLQLQHRPAPQHRLQPCPQHTAPRHPP